MDTVSEDYSTMSEEIEHLKKMNDILLNMVKGRKGPEDVLKDALDSEDLDVLRFLVESEIVDVNTKVKQDFLDAEEFGADPGVSNKISPLSYSVMMRSLKLVQFLLSVAGLDVNDRDGHYIFRNALSKAFRFSSPEIAAVLLQHNAIKFEPKYEIQFDIFMISFSDTVDDNFARGADPENVLRFLQLLIQHPSTTASRMSSGLFDLVSFSTDTSAAYVIRALKMLLGDPKTDVNYQKIFSGTHRTALHETTTVDIARLLVESGADIFAEDSDKKIPREATESQEVAEFLAQEERRRAMLGLRASWNRKLPIDVAGQIVKYL
eukprot:386453_1